MPVELPSMLIVALSAPLQPLATAEPSAGPVADRAARATVVDHASEAWPKPNSVTGRPTSVWRSPTFHLMPLVLCYLLVAGALLALAGAMRGAATFALDRAKDALGLG